MTQETIQSKLFSGVVGKCRVLTAALQMYDIVPNRPLGAVS